MKAGRELDALVAEKVMGALWFRSRTTGKRALFLGEPPSWFTERADGFEPLVGDFDTYAGFPAYSTSTTNAWTVALAAMQRTGSFSSVWAGGAFTVAFGRHVAHAETFPLAICLAALQAVGAGSEGPA